MSRVGPFIVGIIVSQAGYVYLSDGLVGKRNRFMIEHLGAGEDDIYQTQLQGSAAKVPMYAVITLSGSKLIRVYIPAFKLAVKVIAAQYLRPLVQAVGGNAGTQPMGQGMGADRGNAAQDNDIPSRFTDHSMVTSAYKTWNATVIKASGSLVDVIYGGGDRRAAATGEGKSKTNGESSA